MKLDDIVNLWSNDSMVNRDDLIGESLKVPMLHAKYYEIYMHERQILKTHEEKFKNFEFAKWMYYQGKMDQDELNKRGWPPFNHKLLKTDIQRIVDADEEIIDYKLKISQQAEKTEYLKSIIQSINQRTYMIKNAIEMVRFEAGLN